MGAKAYGYWVQYEPDINAVLQKLRAREFNEGRYRTVNDSGYTEATSDLSRRHASLEDAREAGDVDGTASILDIEAVGPSPDFGQAGPLPPTELADIFGSARPTRSQITSAEDELYALLERGHCVYVVAYEGDDPKEIFFAGYSFD